MGLAAVNVYYRPIVFIMIIIIQNIKYNDAGLIISHGPAGLGSARQGPQGILFYLFYFILFKKTSKNLENT